MEGLCRTFGEGGRCEDDHAHAGGSQPICDVTERTEGHGVPESREAFKFHDCADVDR